MKKTHGKIVFLIGFLAGVFAVGHLAAAEHKGSGPDKKMSGENESFMANMTAYSTPNENHAFLSSLAGSWKTVVEHRMSPEAPVDVSEGISENVMIYGGRFLEQSYRGDFDGMPFEGRGLVGYDNILKKFQNVWYDNMATGIMTSTGTYDPARKTISEEGQMSCPLTNDQRWYRAVTTLVDEDHYTYETFMKDAGGREFQAMTIRYARVK